MTAACGCIIDWYENISDKLCFQLKEKGKENDQSFAGSSTLAIN